MKLPRVFLNINTDEISEDINNLSNTDTQRLYLYAKAFSDLRNASYQEYCNIKADDSSDFINEIMAMVVTVSNEQFNPEPVYLKIAEYVSTHSRLSYASVSQSIYGFKITNREGSVLSNIQSISDYAKSLVPLSLDDRQQDMMVNEFMKEVFVVIQKLYDHINLAILQFDRLRQTDVELKSKFDSHMEKYEKEFIKDVNARMMTMLSIFTALAFLLFGGISSLDNVFASKNSFFKIVCLACVWALGMINIIFVFLACAGKMIFVQDPVKFDKKIFQRFPIVVTSNFVLTSVLILSGWFHYVSTRGFYDVFEVGLGSRWWSMPVFTYFIILVLVILGKLIYGKNISLKENWKPLLISIIVLAVVLLFLCVFL